MNVYDLIYVQLQLSLFSYEPVSQYSECDLSWGQKSKSKKDSHEYGFLKPEYMYIHVFLYALLRNSQPYSLNDSMYDF